MEAAKEEHDLDQDADDAVLGAQAQAGAAGPTLAGSAEGDGAVDEGNIDQFLQSLGLQDIGSWRFETVAAEPRRVGKVNYIKANLKATCQVHRRCSCYVTVPAGRDLPSLKHLLRWLVSGVGSTAAQHEADSRRLKSEVFGMRLRRPL